MAPANFENISTFSQDIIIIDTHLLQDFIQHAQIDGRCRLQRGFTRISWSLASINHPLLTISCMHRFGSRICAVCPPVIPPISRLDRRSFNRGILLRLFPRTTFEDSVEERSSRSERCSGPTRFDLCYVAGMARGS